MANESSTRQPGAAAPTAAPSAPAPKAPTPAEALATAKQVEELAD